MVKLFTTSITAATVLSPLLNISFADVTVEVHRCSIIVPNWVKRVLVGLHFSLLYYKNVSWNRCCSVIGQVNSEGETNEKDQAEQDENDSFNQNDIITVL